MSDTINKVFLKFIKMTKMHSGEVNKCRGKNALHFSVHLSQKLIYSQIAANSNKLW